MLLPVAVMSNFDVSSDILPNFTKVQVSSDSSPNAQLLDNKWGLPLNDVYKLALNFYKEKEGKAVQLSYEDRIQLVAFTQQVSHGPLTTSNVAPVGALDVVGRDRRFAWQKLGDLSPDQARSGFITLLARRCPLFETFIEAHRRDHEEQERKAQELARKKEENKKIEAEREKREREVQAHQEQEELSRRKVQQALNEQTYEQFRSYAEQQFPGDPERQGDLVRQLQDQHYLQYMQQLHASTLQTSSVDVSADEVTSEESAPEPEEPNWEGIVPASMWTRPDILTFKEAVMKSDGDGVIRVGHGETVTVRVPTNKDSLRLFWEFATDHYDIGFGMFFEWGTPATNQVSVHVSESEDDEDEEDYDESEIVDTYQRDDLESGDRKPNYSSNKSLLTEIVPVFRRDCQQEVYVGSHCFPGEGVYLLKFDNSYSLWRSKTLYYRIYYTQ